MARNKTTQSVSLESASSAKDFNELENESIENRAKETSKNAKKIGLLMNTPYLSQPDMNTNPVGILSKGTVFEVKREIDAGVKGRFYDIGFNRYISKDCDVIEY